MTVIIMSRTTMSITQYNNVSNIAYNSSAGTFTITYGGGTTVPISTALFTIHIMTS